MYVFSPFFSFQEKAQLDQHLLSELVNPPASSETLTRFCQSLHQLQFLSTAPFDPSALYQGVPSEFLDFVCIEWMLTAQHQFLYHHEQFTDFDTDLIAFQKYLEAKKKWLLQHQKIQEWSKWDDWVYEFVRSGTSELANIASIVGGIAAQEGIKLITGQFVPLTGVWVYNGINGTSYVLPNQPSTLS